MRWSRALRIPALRFPLGYLVRYLMNWVLRSGAPGPARGKAQNWVPRGWILRPRWALRIALGLSVATIFPLLNTAQAPAAAPQAPALPRQVPPPAPRFLVILDAAHGGDDTGAHLDSGQLEKNANLALSIRLRSLLTARGIQVITTRESDSSLDLNQRAALANHANAAACISLHTSESGSGIHLFASSLAPAQPARFTAWKTAQAAWITRSLGLAGSVNSAMTQAGFNVTLARIPLPGIESMTCPALAIEVGPQRDTDHKITTEPDNPDYQGRVATAIAASLLEWRSDPTRTEGRQP